MMPHADPTGLVTAALSAFLFTFAIVYVVRSRRASREIEAPLTSVLSGDYHPMERAFFSSVILEGGRPGLGLIASTALHVLVLGGTPLIPYLFPEELRFDSRKYNVRIVEFRVPEPLLYTAGDRPVARQLTPKFRIVEKALRMASPDRTVTPAEKPPRVRFELPSSTRARTKDVVIQPDQPPENPLTIPRSLPRALLWAQGPVPLSESRLVGAPEDRTAILPRFSMPQAAPVVQRPNRELAVMDLQIADGPVLTFRPPQLPVPPANMAPLGAPARDIDALGELPATPLPLGSPINLIALLEKLAPPSPSYLADLGNRLAERTSETSTGTAGGEGNAAGVPEAAQQGVLTGTHADLLAAAPAAPILRGAPDNRLTPNRSQAAPTGHLGVIVVQHSSLESGLEGAENLSGQPIYTVYFDVPGSPRRWVLQYCVPDSGGPTFVQASEDRIQILPRRSVQPPFPLERMPVDLSGFRGPDRRLVIYALVNERGQMENVRLIRGTGQEIDGTALAVLRRWSFRPATSGDSPVAVEALFGIPLQ